MSRRTALIVASVAALLVGAIVVSSSARFRAASSGPPPSESAGASASPSSPVPGVTASLPATMSPNPSAASPGTSPTSVVLVGAGDIATCDKEGDSETARLVEAIPDAVVFTLGDNAYEDGSEADFRCYDEAWGRFRDRTRPAAGNHEFESTDARPYFQYFGQAAGTGPDGYYAYDAGGWRIYVLNSNCRPAGGCDAGDPQAVWLAGDLAANPRRCVLAMWHHPVFSSGRHGNDPKMKPAWRILAAAGAELILNGHDHTYERFAPQDADGRADPSGIREIVVGTGGKSHYPFPKIRANSEVRDNQTFGVIRLVLSPDRYEWEFIPVPGRSFRDRGSEACH